ncbi:MAG: HPr kinase/phosphorylase [Verrucomicrobiales bacterium]|jgi:HPr kinase/phosphorylase
MPNKTRRPTHVSVGAFFDEHHSKLKLRRIGDKLGLDRRISEPTVNRPGLALAEFYTYFAYRRIQVFGHSEFSYLNSLTAEVREARLRSLFKRDIPCVVMSRGREMPPEWLALTAEAGIPVFGTSMITMKFINAATICLEWDFAPTCSAHGCMIDVKGIGVLLIGKSGSGKSETVLGLLERGASLVADDLVHFRALEGREVIGTAPEIGRSHMEVRGLGVLNIPAIYGIGSMRLEKRLDLVIELKPYEDLNKVERVSTRTQFHTVLGIKIPLVEVPVAPGRDVARLVEVAALDQKLKSFGHDAALEFNKKLLKMMRKRRIN